MVDKTLTLFTTIVIGSVMYVCANIIMVDNYRYWQQKGNMTVFLN